MALSKEQIEAFQKELDELLAKHGAELVVLPLFIDKIGHKHPFVGSDFTAELQVREKVDVSPTTEPAE